MLLIAETITIQSSTLPPPPPLLFTRVFARAHNLHIRPRLFIKHLRAMPTGRRSLVRSNGPVSLEPSGSTSTRYSRKPTKPSVQSTRRPAKTQSTWRTATLKLDLNFDTEPPNFEPMYWQITGSGTMDDNDSRTLDNLTEEMCPHERGSHLPWKTDGSLDGLERLALSEQLEQLCDQSTPNEVEMQRLRVGEITDSRDERRGPCASLGIG